MTKQNAKKSFEHENRNRQAAATKHSDATSRTHLPRCLSLRAATNSVCSFYKRGPHLEGQLGEEDIPMAPDRPDQSNAKKKKQTVVG